MAVTVAVAGAGVEFGVSFLSKFFCLSLLSCTVIFECSTSFLYLMVEISQKNKNIRKLREGHFCMFFEIGVFAGNIC